MKKSNIAKIVVLIIMVIAVTVLLVLLFLDIKSKNQNISKQLIYLSSEVNKEGYSISIQRQLKDLEKEISIIKKSIVPNSGDVEFIEKIEEVAKNNNLVVAIDSLILDSDQKSASSTTITALRVRAKTQGSWQNTYKFIKQIESLSYKVRISSLITINSIQYPESGRSNPKSQWSTVFEIRVLKYK